MQAHSPPCSWPLTKHKDSLFKMKAGGQVDKSSKFDPSYSIHCISKENSSLEIMLLAIATGC